MSCVSICFTTDFVYKLYYGLVSYLSLKVEHGVYVPVNLEGNFLNKYVSAQARRVQ